jgi:hypothetical protein
MNGFRIIFPSFLSHYATCFAKMAAREVVSFDEFYYQFKLTHLFQKHPVYIFFGIEFFKYFFRVLHEASSSVQMKSWAE